MPQGRINPGHGPPFEGEKDVFPTPPLAGPPRRKVQGRGAMQYARIRRNPCLAGRFMQKDAPPKRVSLNAISRPKALILGALNGRPRVNKKLNL